METGERIKKEKKNGRMEHTKREFLMVSKAHSHICIYINVYIELTMLDIHMETEMEWKRMDRPADGRITWRESRLKKNTKQKIK